MSGPESSPRGWWPTDPLIALLGLGLGGLAGFVASLLGIGGGAIIVPLLVLAGVDIKVASPASLVAILGTSLGGLRFLYKRGLVNVRLALVLETATTLGAALGVYLYGVASSRALLSLFGLALYLSAAGMYARMRASQASSGSWSWPGSARLAAALGASMGAGLLSALLGIGGGVIKVPVLVLILGLPIKAAVSTSKLMVGITALVGVVGHTLRGDIDWGLAVPLAAGTYIGASLGSRVLVRARPRSLYWLAMAYYVVTGTYLILRG